MLELSELPLALRSAYLTMHRQTDSVFRPYGVTADQFVLLACLSRGATLTQRELASRMSSDPSTVRAMLVLLEKQGLIHRNKHPNDSRARTVSLSPNGKRVFKQLWTASEPIRTQMLTAIRPAEIEFINALNRLSASLQTEITISTTKGSLTIT